ncbi:MAG: hypothetical protein R3F43_05485 [bacterium]
MDDVLTRSVAWKGPAISAAGLESIIQAERGRQAEQVSTLERLRGRNASIQGALSQELQRLDGLSRSLDQAGELGFWDKVRDFFAFLPGVEKAQAPRSIEALLREQYATSQTRLSEAAAFADQLQAARRISTTRSSGSTPGSSRPPRTSSSPPTMCWPSRATATPWIAASPSSSPAPPRPGSWPPISIAPAASSRSTR